MWRESLWKSSILSGLCGEKVYGSQAYYLGHVARKSMEVKHIIWVMWRESLWKSSILSRSCGEKDRTFVDNEENRSEENADVVNDNNTRHAAYNSASPMNAGCSTAKMAQ